MIESIFEKNGPSTRKTSDLVTGGFDDASLIRFGGIAMPLAVG